MTEDDNAPAGTGASSENSGENSTTEFSRSRVDDQSAIGMDSALPVDEITPTVTGTEGYKPENFSADLVRSILAQGCEPEDIGSAACNHGVSADQFRELVLQLLPGHRRAFIAGYRSQERAKGHNGLSATSAETALTIDSLGSTPAGKRLRKALERAKSDGATDPDGVRDVARALQNLSVPLAWFADALVDAGIGESEVLGYLDLLLPFWRGDRHLTDMGNARRLVALYGIDIRFAPAMGWLVWDGKRWRRDAVGEVEYRAKQIAASWRADAQLLGAIATLHGDGPERKLILERAKDMGAWAKSSESAVKISAIIRVARSEPGVPVLNESLDADPWALNVKNGTIDLRTLTLRPHARADLITKLAPVAYRPGARFRLWERFLDQATNGDLELQDYLQRASGYMATGDVTEEVFFFVYGPGRSGKSTYAESLKSVLGDYAATADFDTFVKRPGGGSPRNDIARLDGRRMVLSIEVDEGRELDKAVVKTITGGDRVSVRYLYKEFFEFAPTFKLVLVANDPPGVDPDDSAMWRRMRVIPMEHVVSKEDSKRWVKQLLTDPDIAGPAILDWVLQGCVRWQAEGLGEALAVEQATAEYRESQDVIGEFIKDCLNVAEDATISASALNETYQGWCVTNGHWPMTPQALGRVLTKKGFKNFHSGVRKWRGLTKKTGWSAPLDVSIPSKRRALPSGETPW